jgi:uncharacterized RmlC-like cupin family protein
MDAEQTIAEIELLERIFAVPDIRPLSAGEQIAAHSHRDDRVATVISGTRHIGYGDKFDESKLKALPPGSFYTEPPGRNHFAETGDEPVIVQITGFGRTLTRRKTLVPANPTKVTVSNGTSPTPPP